VFLHGHPRRYIAYLFIGSELRSSHRAGIELMDRLRVETKTTVDSGAPSLSAFGSGPPGGAELHRTGGHQSPANWYLYLLMLSLLIFASRVVRGIPSRGAAPFGPEMRPRQYARAASMRSLSPQLHRGCGSHRLSDADDSHASSTAKVSVRQRITAR
jgi:hypothetical protein